MESYRGSGLKFGGTVNICALYVPELFQIFWSAKNARNV